MHNQKKANNKFKNRKQPELPESQTAWNSENQGVKETSRPVGGAEMGSLAQRTHSTVADHGGKVMDHKGKAGGG